RRGRADRRRRHLGGEPRDSRRRRRVVDALTQLSPPVSMYGLASRSTLRRGLTDSPSIVMNTTACARDGRSVQIVDATEPVLPLTPCHTPPVGRRSRRLVVVARLHSTNPSFTRASMTSSGAATHPSSASIQVILP